MGIATGYQKYRMTCLLVDDNLISKAALTTYISQIKDIVCCIECNNAMEAWNCIQKHSIDIMFVEIDMPGINGIEFVRNLGNARPITIFTTADTNYAIEAFELQVADYLLKPVQPARFLQAVTNAKKIMLREKELKRDQKDDIFIKDAGIIKRIRINDILYAEAMGDYVKLFTTERSHAVHVKLATVERRLPADKFLRIHRSFIVALNKIDSLQDRALMIHGKCLPVALTYKQILTDRMNILA